MTDRITYCRGMLIGIFIGLCLGMYLMSQMFTDKLPPNPNYVEQMEEKIQDRLGGETQVKK